MECSPPGSLTSDDSCQKFPEKVLHQSLGEEGNDSSVTSPSDPSYKDDTDSDDFVINQILQSINMNLVSEPREHYLTNSGGSQSLSNGLMSGDTFPPAHNGLARGDCAELAAGPDSVFYCDQGCFVLNQAHSGCGHTIMQNENC